MSEARSTNIEVVGHIELFICTIRLVKILELIYSNSEGGPSCQFLSIYSAKRKRKNSVRVALRVTYMHTYLLRASTAGSNSRPCSGRMLSLTTNSYLFSLELTLSGFSRLADPASQFSEILRAQGLLVMCRMHYLQKGRLS